MAESLIALTPGSGAKNARTFSRSILGNTVEEQAFFLAEPNMAAYVVPVITATLITTALSHTVQIMAGGSLNVYLRRLIVYQFAAATTAAVCAWDIVRLTSAGTGGTAFTPAPLDTSDAASGATAMTLPTVKGTEGTTEWRASSNVIQTFGAGPASTVLLDLDFERLRGKAIRIPLGTANGIALKQLTGVAPASVYVMALISEATF